MDTLKLKLNNNKSVYKDNIITYVKFLKRKNKDKKNKLNVCEESIINLQKIIKNISMLTDKALQLLVIDVYSIEQHYNQNFNNCNTINELIPLKTFLNDFDFISIQLHSFSEKEIENMIISIFENIKDDVINIKIYLDMRLENFFVDFFYYLDKEIDKLI